MNPQTMPPGWLLTTLADLFLEPKSDIVDGPFGSNLKATEYRTTGVPILRIQNIERNAFINKNIKFVTKEKAKQLTRHSYKPGDVVLTKLGNPLGKACVVPESFDDGIIVADIVRLRLNHGFIDKQFLVYSINAQQIARQLKSLTKGTTRPRVNLGHVRNLALVLPPLPEQHRIVAKIEELFSELDKGVENFKIAREQLKVYRQSVLKYAFEGKLTEQWRKEHAFELEPVEVLLKKIKAERERRYQQQLEEWQQAARTGKRILKPAKPKELPPLTEGELAELPKLPDGWGWNMLASLADVTGGITKNPERNRFPIKIPFLRVANVYANRLDLAEIHLISVNEQELRRVLLERGDLLVVEGNGSVEQIGRAAIWRGEIEGCAHQNHLIKVRATRYVYPEYCLHFLLSTQGRNMIMKEASSTSGLYTLSTSKVANLKVPLCSPKEQVEVTQEIESRLSVVDQLEQTIDESLQKAEALRQSILKKTFEGKLVPQDPNDEPASVLLERIKAEKAKHSKNVVRKKNTGK
jgi:type I restriction enzyme S subunit